MYRDVRLWQGVAGKVDLYLFLFIKESNYWSQSVDADISRGWRKAARYRQREKYHLMG